MTETRMEIRISALLKDQVEEEAIKVDRSKSWVVREALKQYLSGGKKP